MAKPIYYRRKNMLSGRDVADLMERNFLNQFFGLVLYHKRGQRVVPQDYKEGRFTRVEQNYQSTVAVVAKESIAQREHQIFNVPLKAKGRSQKLKRDAKEAEEPKKRKERS